MRVIIKRGRWWMVHFSKRYVFSLGVHLDPISGYVDFHLPFLIITLGKLDFTEYPRGVWSESRNYDALHEGPRRPKVTVVLEVSEE